MYDLENISYFTGIEFYKSIRGMMMHQRRYANKILKVFEMEVCNATSKPVEPRLQLSKNSDENDADPTQYKRLIGSLRYLCHIRHDLAYNVGMVSRFMQKSNVSHLVATNRILRYLKGTLNYGILFHASDEGKEYKLVDYTDSSGCSDVEDRKFTVCYVFMLGGALVAWSSRKEPVVAMPSCEVEFIVVSLYACQATWMVNLVEEITRKDHGANHEYRQHVCYQSGEEFDSTRKKQTRRNEVPLTSRASSK
ncbi:secreted RxLR effector protein 161-like [Lathyrus oleraceus]|uniref:secreted RxLR effector protein 161-like n=1 Tax=Pisum sativum TaxID=3888 RepID=UPI0021D2ACAE|nr:secreted RxLR effector protein 161-like [Pisum sativum]